MLSTSVKDERPPIIRDLDRIPDTQYNFKHTIVQEAPVPAKIVLWNLIDFAHVNYVHRRLYHHTKILAKKGNVHLLEYGVNQFFFLKLPIHLPYLMWHEFLPPNKVRHLSRSPWGSYTKTEIELEEFEKDGKIYTRLFHTFHLNLSGTMKVLEKFILWYLNRWSAILWEEDGAMLLRRQKVLEAGFLDHPVDAEYRASEGLAFLPNEPEYRTKSNWTETKTEAFS